MGVATSSTKHTLHTHTQFSSMFLRFVTTEKSDCPVKGSCESVICPAFYINLRTNYFDNVCVFCYIIINIYVRSDSIFYPLKTGVI